MEKNTKSYFCVTGMSRSGTTLLQDILNGHTATYCGLQVFPQLFIDIKRDFHQKKKCIENKFVFENYTGRQEYEYDDFLQSLYKEKHSPSFVKESIGRNYAGQWEKIGNIELNYESNLSLSETYKKLLDSIAENLPTKKFLGAKHMLLDEFVPYFLDSGIKCISIIRNPLNVIKSSKFGSGADYVGGILPTLYELRNWRRNVHLSILERDNPNFLAIRYEDLLEQPENILNKVFNWLDTEASKVEIDRIIANSLNNKPLNSSFTNKDTLDKTYLEYSNYVQAICLKEMQYLGYQTSIKSNETIDLIEHFKEPLQVNVPGIDKNYSNSFDSIQFEIKKHKKPMRLHFFGGEKVMEILLNE